MVEYTPRLNLRKPLRGELNWDVPLNQNFDILDELVLTAELDRDLKVRGKKIYMDENDRYYLAALPEFGNALIYVVNMNIPIGILNTSTNYGTVISPERVLIAISPGVSPPEDWIGLWAKDKSIRVDGYTETRNIRQHPTATGMGIYADILYLKNADGSKTYATLNVFDDIQRQGIEAIDTLRTDYIVPRMGSAAIQIWGTTYFKTADGSTVLGCIHHTLGFDTRAKGLVLPNQPHETPATGQVYWNNDEKALKVWDGSTWRTIAST